MATHYPPDTARLLNRAYRPAHADPALCLDSLSVIRQLTETLMNRRDRMARAAKKSGATWKQIGTATGISTQAAHQRWGAAAASIEPVNPA